MKQNSLKKKYIIILAIIGVIALILIYLQWGREVTVCNTMTTSFNNGSIENITIITNKLIIIDKKKISQELIQKCIDNSFEEIKFSYDVNGYPRELQITLYLNEPSWYYKAKAFQIKYSQDSSYNLMYNIKDNPEKFKMYITNN